MFRLLSRLADSLRPDLRKPFMPRIPPGALRLALFDCDGTLVDSQHAILAAMGQAWERAGLAAPDSHAVRRVVGLPLLEAVRALRPGQPENDYVTLANFYRQAFFDLRQKGEHAEPLFPAIRETLDALTDDGILLGIATGKSLRGLRAVLEREDLSHRFVTLQTSDNGPGKPHPDMVHRALAETGVAAEATVVIGDTTFDMMMARSAGVGAIGVTWGYHEIQELQDAGAHRIVSSGGELEETLRALLRPDPEA